MAKVKHIQTNAGESFIINPTSPEIDPTGRPCPESFVDFQHHFSVLPLSVVRKT
jgi:hypothetical protein